MLLYSLSRFYDFSEILDRKRYGSFKAFDDAIAAKEVGGYHVKIKKLSDLDILQDQEIAVFIGNDGIYKTGDIIIKVDGEWVKLVPGSDKLSPCTRLRCRQIGGKVLVRWRDPDDSYDIDMNRTAVWNRTVLVRKYGSAPQSILDGTQVYINYNRNHFNKGDNSFYVDSVPVTDDSIPVFYKAFAISEGGYVANNTEAVQVAAMPWSELVESIREGYGSGIFVAGDVLRLESEDGSKSLDLLCMGNDCTVSSKPVTNPHTIAFAFRYLLPKQRTNTPVFTTFDDPSTYIHTSSAGYVSDGYSYKPTKLTKATGKTYYIKYSTASGIAFRAVRPAIGAVLSADYHERVEESRVNPAIGGKGNNQWTSSDIRALINSTRDDSPIGIIREIDPEFANIIVSSNVTTEIPSADGGGRTTTTDTFFLPSLTEVFGRKNGSVYEGLQFDYFYNENDVEIPDAEFHWSNPNAVMTAELGNKTQVMANWFLRSANVSTVSNVKSINTNGLMIDLDAYDEAGCFVVFSIG